MSLAIAGAAVGGTAVAAYLDAKFHIRNDIHLGSKPRQLSRDLGRVAKKTREGKMYVYSIFEDRVGTPMGDNVFLIFEDRQWTYSEFYRALQPVGNWLLKDLDIQKDEIVVLDGGNSPEYIMLWLALEAIGALPAFVNSNLTSKPLVYSIKLSGARYVLAGSEVRHLVSPVEQELASAGAQTIYYDSTLLQTFTDTEPMPASRRQDHNPLAMSSLMYTSGTTGLPKAVVVTRARELLCSTPSLKQMRLKPGDRMYTCLPLYHASPHGFCILLCAGAGATAVLSRKFSHSTFWPEVHASGANIIQYVGELCRYLLNAPPGPLDRGHKVEVAFGNGMRADVWERFRERFGVQCINELYASSDGMGWSANANRGDFSRNTVAVRGPLWNLLNSRYEKRVLVDAVTQDVVRGGDGFAVEAKAGEAGEVLWPMDTSDPDRASPKYFKNRDAAVNRRISDVFKKGDLWFRSGDMMRQDAEGRVYFVDRLGDTFRWHSENVAATEVGDVVGLHPQIGGANVYGVLVPHTDGRAGCAAIVPREGVPTGPEAAFWGDLADHCLANLPRYAVPVFVRLVKEIDVTTTMKMQKGRLRSEGIELEAIEQAAKDKGEAVDAMYWLPPGEKSYVPFTRKNLQEMKGGSVRL